MPLVKALAIAVLSLFALSACADAGNELSIADTRAPEFGGEAEAPGDVVLSETTIDLDEGAYDIVFSQLPERLIVRSGNLDIIVEDTEETLQKIVQRVEASGGWIVSSNIFENGGYKSGSVTIRVPADRFNQTLSDIKNLAMEVSSEYTDSQDVTEEFVDLESRLTLEHTHQYLPDDGGVVNNQHADGIFHYPMIFICRNVSSSTASAKASLGM